ncbi:MAG: hypothetical protein ACYSR0_00485 [Planctomycetota bacterium]|jgi:hypothetical protein
MLVVRELEKYEELQKQIEEMRKNKKKIIFAFDQLAPDGVLLKCARESKHDFILSPRELVDWILREDLLVCCNFPMGWEVVDDE